MFKGIERERTDLVASEHMRTLYLLLLDDDVVPCLNILKKTGVYSSRFFDASVARPKGPIPPGIKEPVLAQTS